MMYANGLALGQNQEELIQMDQMGFPYACYYREMDNRFQNIVPWHWHKSLEINLIVEGAMTLTTSDQEIPLNKGDLCLVNSGVLHYFRTDIQTAGCKFYTHLFHTTFLSGMHNSLIDQKYFLPITGDQSITAYIFPYGTEINHHMTPYFLKIVELDQKHPCGFELLIREELSRLWLTMFLETDHQRSSSTPQKHADARRIKIMIQFIHDHYKDSLSLSDIAGSASISRQECMRCFRKYIHSSPFSYLTEYRIRIAADQLLRTDNSILMISENCGFSSASYFTKVFKSVMSCTPKEYRKLQI